MALAPFFERIYGALGAHLAISRESLDHVLREAAVGLACAGRLSTNDRWIAEMSVNLLARLYPRIGLIGASTHTATWSDLAKRINPDIEIVKTLSAELTIEVGRSHEKSSVYPQASGWLAGLDGSVRWQGPPNPLAAAAAAALACAEIFRRVFLKQSYTDGVAVSLLNFDADTGKNLKLGRLDIGDVLFAGVGAVGNAAIWALSRMEDLRGSLTLVDDEEVALSNLQRYVLTDLADVGAPKVALARRHLQNTGLVISEKPVRIERVVEPQHAAIAVSVDNVAGRRAAQALLPKLVVNGWTGEQALGASWHEFSRNAACLACLYHPHGQVPSAVDQAAQALGLSKERTALLWVTHHPLMNDDIAVSAASLGVDREVLAPWLGKSLGELYTDVVCGAVPLDVTGVGKIEVVPLAHQSVLAGVLMAAELLKRTHRKLAGFSQPETLVSWDNILAAPPKYWAKPRPRERGCICGDADYQQRYSAKWRA